MKLFLSFRERSQPRIIHGVKAYLEDHSIIFITYEDPDEGSEIILKSNIWWYREYELETCK